MTDNDEMTTDTSTPVEAPGGPVEASETNENLDGGEDDHDGQEDGDKGSNREAAKYRRKLRDAEAERDALATRLETLQRAEAERLASKHLAKGAALWVGGTALADVLDDDGDVDPAKVTERAQHVRDEYGVGQSRAGRHVVAREGENPSVRSGGDSMVDVVMGRRP